MLEPGTPARWRRTRTLRGSVGAAAPPARIPAPSEHAGAASRVGLVLLAGLVAWGGWRWSAADDSFSERLSDGCEQIDACRQLETEAAQRVQSCWLGCGRELSEHRMARSLRYRAEERSAVHEHYRQRDDAERSEQQLARAQQLAEWQREQAARSADAEREQRQRLELERLRQDRIDQRVREERLRRVAYLALLGPEARAERLQHCRAEPAGCQALVLDLIEAAPQADEKRKLAERSERLLQGATPAARVVAPKRAAPAPNS
ncbi:MAG: hypothetical protein ABI895_32270 [Deltaproteobacteria bacterium]